MSNCRKRTGKTDSIGTISGKFSTNYGLSIHKFRTLLKALFRPPSSSVPHNAGSIHKLQTLFKALLWPPSSSACPKMQGPSINYKPYLRLFFDPLPPLCPKTHGPSINYLPYLRLLFDPHPPLCPKTQVFPSRQLGTVPYSLYVPPPFTGHVV